jgi:hypothetical protein
LIVPDYAKGDFMPKIQTGPMRPAHSIVPSDLPSDSPSDVSADVVGDIPTLSDDECVVRLAQAIADHDSDHLDEVAKLIGRLAVPIE